jgi:hypothetical protein
VAKSTTSLQRFKIDATVMVGPGGGARTSRRFNGQWKPGGGSSRRSATEKTQKQQQQPQQPPAQARAEK